MNLLPSTALDPNYFTFWGHQYYFCGHSTITNLNMNEGYVRDEHLGHDQHILSGFGATFIEFYVFYRILYLQR